MLGMNVINVRGSNLLHNISKCIVENGGDSRTFPEIRTKYC